MDELKQLSADLDGEKNQIRDDKIELEIFKNELKTKQKTIESMRFNYIKGDQENMVHKAELISNAKGGAFTPLKPPTGIHQMEPTHSEVINVPSR